MFLLVIDNMLEVIPSILKYGISGLSAIVFLLAFYLLQAQNKKEEPNSQMLKNIKWFMITALIFSFASVGASIIEGIFHRKDMDSINEIRKGTLVEVSTNSIASRIEQVYSKHQFEGGEVRKTADHASNLSLEATSPQREKMNEDEFKEKVLRQAVFSSIHFFVADKEILEESLERIDKRGYSMGDVKEKVLSEFDALLGERYQWLQRQAIPEAQAQIDSASPVSQVHPTAVVSLPEDLWIFTSYDEGNQPSEIIDFEELESLRSELDLLKRVIL